MFLKHISPFMLIVAAGSVLAQETEIRHLSGKGPSDGVEWAFFCTGGRRSGAWEKITVPSNWELEGFGEYNYGHHLPKHDEAGRYRHDFRVPAEWRGRTVRVVFDGVMTDCEVRVNGKPAGPVHQGGFYRFKHDITKLLNYGADNLLEVEVRKVSAEKSVEMAERKADYWVFGGIYRPVFLEALPAEHIDRVAIDGKADGSFRARVFLGDLPTADRLTARVETLDGKPLGAEMTARPAEGSVELQAVIPSPKTWSAETPRLYQVRLRLHSGEKLLHEVTQRFGFRTIEVRRGEGIFVNGTRVMLKGVNRHSFRPATGRALDPEDNLEDVRLLKSMNMNAVRCSHYPPDKVFLELCDRHGLYVIDELCTWQRPALSTEVARKLVRELIERDVNHPCILFWANGNEGGWNTEVDGDYPLHDPQQRLVLHPWDNFSGVNTDHYETYASTLRILQQPEVHLPTEFLHGLYDGGHGAGLEDYWSAMEQAKTGGGGFLWVMADEGVVRTDQDGAIDTMGNRAPDGIVGPNHQKEGSYHTIRELWSPVRFPIDRLPSDFNGRLPVANRYDFLTLDHVGFAWNLLRFDSATGERVVAEGTARVEGIRARSQGHLELPLPENRGDAHALRVTARDGDGNMIHSRTWPLQERETMLRAWEPRRNGGKVALLGNDPVRVKSGDAVFTFSKETGQLTAVTVSERGIGLANGPRLSVKPAGDGSDAQAPQPKTVLAKQDGEDVLIDVRFDDSAGFIRWTVRPAGILQLDYRFPVQSGGYHYAGVAFDLEESRVKSKRWLGGGPHRVWQNRMRGPEFGLWENAYNDGVPGETWDLPAFKGCFRDVHWMHFGLAESSFTVAPMNPDTIIGVLKPRQGKFPQKATWEYPDAGGLFFFQVISAVGTKFHRAAELGPQSEPREFKGPVQGRVVFTF